MRLLFICKRHPQQRDLIERPYGRFYHLPAALAALGHVVRVQLCGYRRLSSIEIVRAGVTWSSHDILTQGTRTFWTNLSTETRDFQPDWVIGCSDAWVGWLAHRLASRQGRKLAIDAYDNFEAYSRWNIPLHWLWRRALHSADQVTAAGPQLAEKLQRSTASKVHVIPMSADPAFIPGDRDEARRLLDLPTNAPLFGYSGVWSRGRNTDLILRAFDIVRAKRPDSRLVLTGRPPAYARSRDGVICLGYLTDERMPSLFNALNVACVFVGDSAFGRYSYPAKLCEAIACNVAVAASGPKPVRWMLNEDPRFIARVGDAVDHARIMLANIDATPHYPILQDWRAAARELDRLLTA
jgi:glycosyltransferase involved in cell wall biosynthesis